MPRSVDVDAKQAEFIEASVNVIAHHGLSAATMRKISEEAGCTTGSLTHYFPSRKDILLKTLRFVHDKAAQRMIAAIATELTPKEKLLAVLKESLPLTEESLTGWRVWLAFWSASMDDKELSRENERRYSQWLTLVESLLEPLLSKPSLVIESKRVIALVDGLGVGLARQRTSARLLVRAQQGCEAMLVHHISAISSNS